MVNMIGWMESMLEQEHSPLSEDETLRLYQKINTLFRKKILDLDQRDICLFLPHCLRSRHCPASSDDEGVHCEKCGLCLISTLISASETHGVRSFYVPGGGLLENLVKKYRSHY